MTERPSPARSALDDVVTRLRAGERLILNMPRQHGRSAAHTRFVEAHARRNEVVPKPFPRA